MKIVLTAIFDSEDDGVVGTDTITREDVDDLHSLAQAVGDFTRSCGYTYVNDVGFEKDDGSMAFGGF